MKHFFLSLLLILLMQSNSYAYLDPGTGSIFLQYLLVGIAAVASTATSFWQKARDFFIKKIVRKKEVEVKENLSEKISKETEINKINK